MATDVLMPRLSDSMEEGTVLKWLVEEGGEVKRGQPLVEIETDKANMTYDADSDGVLLEVLAQEGDTLPIGEPIARVGEPGEVVSGDGAGQSAEATEPQPEAAPAPAAEEAGGNGGDQGGAQAAPAAAIDDRAEPAPAPGGGGGERLKASPVARRVAGELGVEIARLEGSGPGGRIVKADVEAAAGTRVEAGAAADGDVAAGAEGEAREGTDRVAVAPEQQAAVPAGEEAEPATCAPAAEQAEPAQAEAAAAPAAAKGETGAKGEVTLQDLSRLQQTVSRRMAESKATVPDFALELDVDMTLCIELRERLREQADPAPSFNDMIVKAAASALREHPRVNGAYRDGRFELYSRVNVGVAVAAADALVVPVITDADGKSLGEISRQTRRLIERVRAGEITPPELSGGTFTVSNLGMYGIERFTAIVNPPQAAIMTVGALKKKPAVDDRGRVVGRDLLTLTLVCDHRILYGADGAEFLARVRELLEQPLSLAL